MQSLGALVISNRPPNSCIQECSGRICPLFLRHFPGSGPLLQDSSQDRASPALSKHAAGGWLHNSFPISCTLPGLLEAPAAKCKQVSPLTPTPAAQPAVTQPAASLGHPASGCTLRQQPSFFHWVRPRPLLSLCVVIVPSPSPEKGPVPLCWVPGLSMQSHAGRHLPAAQGELI